jgi:hypothetical protein
MSVPAEPCPDDVPPEIREQALSLVQIASMEVMAHADDPSSHRGLVRELVCARRHGLSIADLCRAAGLDEAHVLELLRQAA